MRGEKTLNYKETEMKEETFLNPEDYAEPRCVLCGEPYGQAPKVKPVPMQRIVEKVDEFQRLKDFEGAERMLQYWLSEAELGNDQKGQLGIRNEFIGLYRKNDRKEQAFENIEEALKLLEKMNFGQSITAGTTYTNSATAYYTFGEYEKALPLFEKAMEVYVSVPGTAPSLLGGLYNNMGLTCVALQRYDRAETLYEKALNVMKNVPDGELEQAITCLNMADAKNAEKGMEEAEAEIFSLLDKAEKLLQEKWQEIGTKSDNAKGYYAFVCESCAPTFSFYGYFFAAQELERRAREIYDSQRS